MQPNGKELVPSGQRGMTARQEFGATEIQRTAETAASAVAAREQAAVQARYIIADRNRREMEDVRVRLLKECDRPGFAEVARYRKPVGSKQNDQGKWEQQYAEGWSVRFAEAAIRCMTNLYPDAAIVYEGDDLRIVRFTITDLESNVTYSGEVSLRKTVERKRLKSGQSALAERTNSYGDKVYIVEATDDELQMKQNSAWSKFIRNGLRFVPGDILDECERRVQQTLAKQDREDPDAAKRKLIDAFAEQGVGPVDLQAYLGHALDRVQPAELIDLRKVFTSIRDGETTWDDVMEAKGSIGSADQQQKVAEEKIRKTQAPAPEQKQAPAPAETQTTEPEPPAATTETKPAGQKPVFGRRQ